MKHPIRLAGLAVVVATVSVAAVTKPQKHLTPERVAEVAALSGAANPEHVTVEISTFGKVRVAPDGQKNVMENIREFRYPTEFDPPQADAAKKDGASGAFPVTPTTPRAFDTINTGWTITLSAKARGGLVEVCGVADWVEVQLVTGGYGALSGPITTDKGIVITPNKLELPKTQTTTTRFHLFAVPGESYEVLFYHGSKVEKHTITVRAE